MKYLVILLIVKLFSGGVCIGTWQAEKVTYPYQGAGYVSFTDTETNNLIKIRGTFIVEKIWNKLLK